MCKNFFNKLDTITWVVLPLQTATQQERKGLHNFLHEGSKMGYNILNQVGSSYYELSLVEHIIEM